MKKPHLNFDIYDWLKRMKHDAKLYRMQAKKDWREDRPIDAMLNIRDAQTLEWCIESLETEADTGKPL